MFHLFLLLQLPLFYLLRTNETSQSLLVNKSSIIFITFRFYILKNFKKCFDMHDYVLHYNKILIFYLISKTNSSLNIFFLTNNPYAFKNNLCLWKWPRFCKLCIKTKQLFILNKFGFLIIILAYNLSQHCLMLYFINYKLNS